MKNLKQKLESGELVRSGKKVYTREEWNQIQKAEHEVEHFDLLQLTYKILLNSTYGALLSQFFSLGDSRMGASTTSSGRQVTTHMIETISFALTGERTPLIKHTEINKKGKPEHSYSSENDCIVYGDTDSQVGTTLLRTTIGDKITFEQFFNRANIIEIDTKSQKQYAKYLFPVSVLTYSPETNSIKFGEIDCVYRNKVSKKIYTIELENGKSTTVTEDHSLMVERNNTLIEIKPSEILEEDIFICISEK